MDITPASCSEGAGFISWPRSGLFYKVFGVFFSVLENAGPFSFSFNQLHYLPFDGVCLMCLKKVISKLEF
jgi:hypothetical protein